MILIEASYSQYSLKKNINVKKKINKNLKYIQVDNLNFWFKNKEENNLD